MPNTTSWAKAIALRITDEWAGKEDFPEDANLMREVLTNLFASNPKEMKKLVGTGIIEKDYFDKNL